MSACAAPGDDPENPPSASLVIEGFIGGAWTTLHTASLTLPTDPTVLGDSYTIDITGSASFSAAASCDIRVRIVHSRHAWTPGNTGCRLTSIIELTDWRLTTSDTEVACGGSSGTGGEEPDGGGEGGGGGGGGGDCTCDWSAVAAPTGSPSAVASPTCSSSEVAAPTTTWTKVGCP